MKKLVISPEAPEFSFNFGQGSIASDGEAAILLRRYFRKMPKLASLSWSVQGLEYDYLRAFFRNATAFGSLPFLVDMPTQGVDVTEHKALFVVGSMKIAGRTSVLYTVSASAWVLPNA